MADIADTLKERGSRYGDFATNAKCAQAIKKTFCLHCEWMALPADMREALDLIATKLSRTLTGDHDHIDNWHDIAGYASLVEQRLREEAK